MSQYEQEDDRGRGGGEVDDDALRDAWKRSEQNVGASVDPETGTTPQEEPPAP